MLRLVVLGGTGDAYLVCALVEAFRAHHSRADVEVVTHSKLTAVAALFPGITHRVDDALVACAEQNEAFQRSHDNLLFASDTYYVHPCFARSGIRIDQLTAKDYVSQADMYRVMLRLPPDALLTLPSVPVQTRNLLKHHPPRHGTVLMLTEATSWPNNQPKFWLDLKMALLKSGREVILNDRLWPLAELFVRAAAASWVIGPQCGVMSILVTGRFPCRKTLASPSTDNYVSPSENWWATRTYPYGYVTKFAGEDHDVEEYKITNTNHTEVVAAIVGGVNARFSSPGVHDPSPVMTVTMPITPGDFLDRLAVLTVKCARFSPERRASIEREYQRYAERLETLVLPQAAKDAYGNLVELHERTFDLLEEVIPNGGGNDSERVIALDMNRRRVWLKRRIDEACHAPYTEVKSYYDNAPVARAAE